MFIENIEQSDIRPHWGRRFYKTFRFYKHTNPPGLGRMEGSFTRFITTKKRRIMDAGGIKCL